MSSVSKRISAIKQPRGGYINPNRFMATSFDDGVILEQENINPILVGISVDYLTRLMLGSPPDKAFFISLMGAKKIHKETDAINLIKKLDGLSELSVISACKLAGFDVCYRLGPALYKPVEAINPDSSTIHNIKTMVGRSLLFLKKYGPVLKDGFTFEGGYTKTVTSGDGDFLTKDTLWDFKVSKAAPTANHTLQLLIYYIMGTHSRHSEFRNTDYLGIFNPRLNKVYRFNLSDLDGNIIQEVEQTVICY